MKSQELSGNSVDYQSVLMVSSSTTFLLMLASWRFQPSRIGSMESRSSLTNKKSGFKFFQLKYLSVMVLVYRKYYGSISVLTLCYIVADWLQGSYQYALYKQMGYSLSEIAMFFVVGFGSSALVGTRIASLADVLGRKKGCLAFCVIYGLSCATKLDKSLASVLIGRFLGGISTSLFYSVFESWMVGAHRQEGFHSDLLDDTFAWSTFVNGLTAIVAGVIAKVLVDQYGLISPFLMAGVICVFSFFVISVCWKENYGSSKPESSKKANVKSNENEMTFFQVAGFILSHPKILATGLTQCAFEIAMYIFIFLWGHVLENSSNSLPLPFGIVFSIFMVMIMLGSLVFKTLISPFFSTPYPFLLMIVFSFSGFSFINLALQSSLDQNQRSEWMIFLSFAIYEACCGLYYPTIASLRSLFIPESSRSTVLNWFRVPLNICVVLILLFVDKVEERDKFWGSAFLMGIGLLSSVYLMQASSDKEPSKPNMTGASFSTPIREKSKNILTQSSSSMMTRSRSKKID